MSRFAGYDADDSDESDNEPIQASEEFKDRHHGNCTDIPCCILWVLCLIALVGVAGYGFVNGNPKRLHHGIQFDGEVCGVGVNVTSKPYLYFCPPADWVGGHLAAAGFNLNLNYPVCVAACPVGPPVPVNVTTFGLEALDKGLVPPQIVECGYLDQGTAAYKTSEEMNYCVPDSAIHNTAKNAVADGISGASSTFMKFADSLAKGWPIYVVIFLLAMFLGYAYLCCLKVFARCMVWLAIIVAFLALAVAGVWLIMKAPDMGTNQAMKENFGNFATMTAYVLGGLCCLAAFAILALMCCCFSQIEYAVVAVKMTGDVMAHIPTLLLGPILKSIAKFTVGMLLLIGFVYLLSIAHPIQVAGTQMRTFAYEPYEWGLILFYAFMFFWILSFMTALYQFAVAYVTADYYFSVSDFDGDRDVGCCGIMEGMCVGLMWHSGSLAFGSFIIACFEMVQKAIEYVNRASSKNPIAKCVSCCCICCIYCCKSCAEFVNKNAYIGVAIKGYNFCRACKKAFEIMIKMAGGMAVLNGATFVFQFAGIILITAICTVIAQMFSSVGSFTDPSSSWFIPHPPVVVVVSAIIGYAVAKVFMDVFDMVSDTLMYCFGLEGFDSNSRKCPPAVKEAFKDTDALNREKEQE